MDTDPHQFGDSIVRLGSLVTLLIGVMGLACVGFVILLAKGYGTVHFDRLPQGATIRINGNTVTQATVRLRPGTYTIAIATPTTAPFQGSLHITLFHTLHYQPRLARRDPNAIASSVIGAVGSTAPVDIYHLRWFNNDTWIAGTVQPGNAGVALQYTGSQWKVAFLSVPGYPQDLAKLPTPVGTYVRGLHTGYASD